MSDKDIEQLCAGYRASIEDPPYDATDAALLHAAAQRARRLPRQRVAYGIAAALVAALGLAVGLWSKTPWRRSSVIDTRQTATLTATLAEGQRSKRRSLLLDNYLTHATLGSDSAGRLDYAEATTPLTQVRASAIAAKRAALSCGPSAEVDLNAPGVLAGLRGTDPGDYAKIMGILAGLTQHPDLDVARWIAVSFQARGVSYLPLWRTSLPPKRLLGFCLGSTRYRVVLTIAPTGAQVSLESAQGQPPR